MLLPMESFDPSLKRSLMNNIRFHIQNFNYSCLDRTFWNFRPVQDSYNRLFIMTGGEGRVVCGGKTVILRPGNLYLIPGHNVIDLLTDDYVEKFWVNFILEPFPGFDCCRSLPFVIQRPYDPSLMDRISSCNSDDDPIKMLKLHNLLLEIIINLMEPYSGQLINDMAVMVQHKELFSWLENNCRADLSVEEMARVSGVSPAALRKTFRKGCGISPKTYLNKRLMEKGKSLLCFSDLNVTQIARELGFDDVAYFSRYFKKHSGFSPLAFRKKFSPSAAREVPPLWEMGVDGKHIT